MALGGSQYINMKHIMEELASRGHQVDNSQYNLRPLFVCHVQAKVVDAISKQTGRFVMPYFKLTYWKYKLINTKENNLKGFFWL